MKKIVDYIVNLALAGAVSATIVAGGMLAHQERAKRSGAGIESIVTEQSEEAPITSLLESPSETYTVQPETAHPERNHSLSKYIDAIIRIESGGNPRATRYESHINDTSIGLGQLLTKTAEGLEKKHSHLPRLRDSENGLREDLMNPEINRAYTSALFSDELKFYDGDPFLAVAAYNAGHFAPRNARIQEQLNTIYSANLATDGALGPQSKALISRFQKEHGLLVDGRIGQETYSTLQNVWAEIFPEKPNPKGIIPQNKQTPYHVRKFIKALEN